MFTNVSNFICKTCLVKYKVKKIKLKKILCIKTLNYEGYTGLLDRFVILQRFGCFEANFLNFY